jgi:hypothetical protein
MDRPMVVWGIRSSADSIRTSGMASAMFSSRVKVPASRIALMSAPAQRLLPSPASTIVAMERSTAMLSNARAIPRSARD